ncbi:MAG: hypothetical protein Q8N60_04210, partial [Candidatus Diapherotrites archaeon]|nr:hypothetical protein [Candidatus Diapherotrites archaeon]
MGYRKIPIIGACILVGALVVFFLFVNCIGCSVSPPDVQTVAQQMIRNYLDMPGYLNTSTAAVFKAGSNLPRSALVGNTALVPEQICLHKGDLKDNGALEVTDGSIWYTGATNL